MAKLSDVEVTFSEVLQTWEKEVVEANAIIEEFEELLNMEGVYLEYGAGSLANRLEAWRDRVTLLGVSGMPTDGRASGAGSTPPRNDP